MIHPNDTFEFPLGDGETTGANTPTLIFKHGTAASWRNHRQRLDEALQETDDSKSIDLMTAIIEERVVGRRGIDDDLAEIMSLSALRFLAVNLPYLADISETNRKNFESPSPLAAAASAETAQENRGAV